MTTAGPPPTPSATPAVEANLALKAKIFVGACAALTTLFTAGINSWATYKTAIAQSDDATRKSDVRKLEDQFQQFTGLTRVFVAGLNAQEPSAAAREAVAVNVQQQYDFLGTLEPLLTDEKQRVTLEDYRRSLVEMNKSLRHADDVRSAMPFARAVSEGVDARLELIAALRGAAGMPYTPITPSDREPDKDFASL